MSEAGRPNETARSVGAVPLGRRSPGDLPPGRVAVGARLRSELGDLTAARPDEALSAGSREDSGLDRGFRERTAPLFRFLFEKYWRVSATGLENVPETGGAILIGNHSGGLPFDATMVAYALSECAGGPYRARAAFIGYTPYLIGDTHVAILMRDITTQRRFESIAHRPGAKES